MKQYSIVTTRILFITLFFYLSLTKLQKQRSSYDRLIHKHPKRES